MPCMPSSSKYKIISSAARRKVSTKTRLNFVMKLSPCWDVLVHKHFLDRVSLGQILAFCHFVFEYTWRLHLSLGKHSHQKQLCKWNLPAQRTERVIFLTHPNSAIKFKCGKPDHPGFYFSFLSFFSPFLTPPFFSKQQTFCWIVLNNDNIWNHFSLFKISGGKFGE